MCLRIFIVAAGLLLCNQTAWAAPNYHGRVLRVKPGELAVTIGTEEFEFMVTSRTRIEVDGKPARLDTIRKGSVAVVEADRFGDVRIARRITARVKLRIPGTVRTGAPAEEPVAPLGRESPVSGPGGPTPRSDLNLDRR